MFIFEISNQINKLYSVQNRFFCDVCCDSYIDSNYSNHLRSQGHINNVIKKHCCSCNSDSAISRDKLGYNNHDLTCCIRKLSLKLGVNI